MDLLSVDSHKGSQLSILEELSDLSEIPLSMGAETGVG